MLSEKQIEVAKTILYTYRHDDWDEKYTVEQLASILHPQPAPLPQDAIEAACAVYHDELHGEHGSWQDLKPELKPAFRECMAAVLRNFAQRPDVLGPVSDEERGGFDAGNGWLARTNAFLGFRRNNLFAPKEPSLEQELNEICSYAATIEESPRETSRKLLALIQRQQGKGKE